MRNIIRSINALLAALNYHFGDHRGMCDVAGGCTIYIY
ncbi:putative tRAP transporter, DctQ-like membrane protein [Escherichia coli P0299917.5]|nr:putative tRAP transporter, DctQ-like membrane protein [Escherichia coli P0299917.10]ENC43725.1 putative tRAP transporter, DctQ-like membrane protein [Escherichia coli P0299917.2]ENC52152.1 putative tRAP transporter, DctQ-like membrane protein [Escherichia coli P0299917.4]ENC56850.1 putative tRAP transporter, DctQ-like membrane protein [Escherichia coli P0299917.5]ENC66532.1 putative tRAP transporter, DctQ-like membrane protein [Escherichia coli P0299917.6]ENC66978.1 putative tRAP transporte